jgi:hypothetical protein
LKLPSATTCASALGCAAKMLQVMYGRPFHQTAAEYCLLGRLEDCLEPLRPRPACARFDMASAV